MTDTPIAGLYRTRLARGGPFVPVRIWHGPPLDPAAPRLLDRSPRWQALASGSPVEIERVWPWCGRFPIDLARYRFMLRSQRWAERYQPGDPSATPRQAVDWTTAAAPF